MRSRVPCSSSMWFPSLGMPVKVAQSAAMSHSEALSRLIMRERRRDMSRGIHNFVMAAALIGLGGLAVPAAAQVSHQPPAVRAFTVTPERITASAAAAVGLIGAVIGALALARPAGRIDAGNRRHAAIVALVMGPI